ERAGRAGADRDADERRKAEHRVKMAGGEQQADERGEHHERHHPRFHQGDEVRDLGRARCERGLGPLIDRGQVGHQASSTRTANAARRYLIRGSTSNWWNGGGDGSVHSSVVAPAPHGLSAARSSRRHACSTPKKKTTRPKPEM